MRMGASRDRELDERSFCDGREGAGMGRQSLPSKKRIFM